MKVLYPEEKPLNPFVKCIFSLCSAAAYFLCCLPSFYLIGHLFLQISLSMVLSGIITLLLFLVGKRSLQWLGNGMSLFLMSILIYSIIHQAKVQIESCIYNRWINTFFYDKPLTVAIVWGTAFIIILLARIILPYIDQYSAFRQDFKSYFKNTTNIFIIFYCAVLLYCFILQRSPGTQAGFNLIPFVMIRNYLDTISYAYESSFYLIGNLLCFLPLGFFYRIRSGKNFGVKAFLIPVVLSLVIEVSQLLLNMGDFDIDDIIMNSFGFYVGLLVGWGIDQIRNAITKGSEKSIF